MEEQFKERLEKQYKEVMTTDEAREKYEFTGFCMGLALVKRKSDGVTGTLDFTHSPRFYYQFIEG